MDLQRVVARYLEGYTRPKNMLPVYNREKDRIVYVLPDTLKDEGGTYEKIPDSRLNTQGKPAPRRHPGQPQLPRKPKKPHKPQIEREPPPAPIHPPIPPKPHLPPKKPKPVKHVKPPKVPKPSGPHEYRKLQKFLYAAVDPLANRVSVRFQAPKSLVAKPGLVRVEGLGRVWAEPPDGDDTFPPAIASYRFVDGWLVYEGRNGSEGVIVGNLSALTKWMHEVDKTIREFPLHEARPWVESDGGKENLVKAQKAADRVFPGVKFEFLTSDHEDVSGEAVNGRGSIVNAHLDATHELGGQRVHSGSQVAAHEAAHVAYSHNPDEGKKVTEALVKWGQHVSMYHGLAGHFEGTMEAVSWWALAPGSLKAKAPELFEVIENWLG